LLSCSFPELRVCKNKSTCENKSNFQNCLGNYRNARHFRKCLIPRIPCDIYNCLFSKISILSFLNSLKGFQSRLCREGAFFVESRKEIVDIFVDSSTKIILVTHCNIDLTSNYVFWRDLKLKKMIQFNSIIYYKSFDYLQMCKCANSVLIIF
jgi:hypothetical protein